MENGEIVSLESCFLDDAIMDVQDSQFNFDLMHEKKVSVIYQ